MYAHVANFHGEQLLCTLQLYLTKLVAIYLSPRCGATNIQLEVTENNYDSLFQE